MKKKLEEALLENMTRYLEPQEIARMQRASLEEENRRLQLKVASLELELASSRLEPLRLKSLILKSEHDIKKADHIKWFASFKQKYNIPEGSRIGYDPESGELTVTRGE